MNRSHKRCDGPNQNNFHELGHEEVFTFILLTVMSAATSCRTRDFQSSRARKRNLQHQKKSDSATRKNVEAGFGQDLTYTVGDSVAAESSLGTSLYPCLLKTSDSDFSDAEGGQAVKTRVTQGRVRKAALSLLACITKVTVTPHVCALTFVLCTK